MQRQIQFTLNGRPTTLRASEERSLLHALRVDLGLTGTKYGCGEGQCGACVVVLDGRAERACRVPLARVHGKQVLTIEGLARNGTLHPLQQAFIDHGALQCGYCTPGMLLQAYVLLRDNPRPSRSAVLAHLERNLCRCGAHQRIVDAIESVSRQAGGRP